MTSASSAASKPRWRLGLFPAAALLLALAAGASAEPADLLITARYVVTMDPQRRVIQDGAVAVRGDRIAAAGPRADLEKRFQPKRVLRRPESLIAPGLINTHTHAAMSLFRGIADDLRLQDWLEKYIFPAEAKNVTADFVRWGTRLACAEMLLSGTTTFTDMYYFEDIVAEVAREAGMRGVLGQTVIGFPVADAKSPQDALAYAERFIRRFVNDALVTPAVAPHALYTNSDESLKAARALANRYRVPLLIHVSETRRENDEVRKKRGKSPIQVLDSLGLFEGRTLAAHVVWADDADLAVLAKRGVGVAHCPSSNMKLSSGVARVERMLTLNIAVGLGPDGPAGSNNDFNLFEEMDLAAKLQKVTSGNPQALPARRAFEMATLLGARALGLDARIGSLEPGKLADLITVRLDAAHAVPLYDVYSHLVYAAKGSDVEDVLVNGRIVVEGGKTLTLNFNTIRERARRFGEQVGRSLHPH
ncbi:MAG: amidohydrolase family protein [Bryobacteraceae bacterium]